MRCQKKSRAMKSNFKNIDNISMEELVNQMICSPDDYKNLKVFLHRRKYTNSRPDNYFLMVTPKVFGKVEVLDLTVDGNFIIVEFFDCAMQEIGIIHINIYDDKPSALFICWQDVKKMVLDETISSYYDDNYLLEFDYD